MNNKQVRRMNRQASRARRYRVTQHSQWGDYWIRSQWFWSRTQAETFAQVLRDCGIECYID